MKFDVRDSQPFEVVVRPVSQLRERVRKLGQCVHKGEENAGLAAHEADEDVPDAVTIGDAQTKPHAALHTVGHPDADGHHPEN